MNYLKYFVFFLSFTSFSFAANKINYQEPRPDAILVSVDNNIIISFENPLLINETEAANSLIIIGTKSMLHSGTIFISSDKKKIIFKPSTPFSFDEKINVKLTGKLSNLVSSKKDYLYSFTTASQKIQWDPMQSIKDEMNTTQDNITINEKNDFPLSLPTMTVTIDNDPSNGSLFLSNFRLGSIAPYLIISDKNGIPYYYQMRTADCYDFKKQPNGNLTFFDASTSRFYEMDINYNVVNSYYCGNGYATDVHELRVLNNGNAYLMAYDPEIVDMSLIVPGGATHANVIGLIIQEIDQNKNVIFQWRSWDHFAITDAWHQNLLAPNIDAVHGNAIEIDNDSNIIICSRHLDEVTKINRTTGDIIWRFGGKNNQFTFLGDTLKFTYQHAIRRISNGNLTLFDNGNYHNPPFSRAVEYSMNENNMTVTSVWEYRHTPDIASNAMGYVQRLSGGNTLISWGLTNPSVTEVTPDGTRVFEMYLPSGDFSYRVFKYDWNGSPLSINNEHGRTPSSFELNQNYPNPFNPTTKISYTVAKSSDVKLFIYDVLGREVQMLVNQKENPGTYEVEWNANNFSSGVYFYKLQAGDFNETRKMTLVK